MEENNKCRIFISSSIQGEFREIREVAEELINYSQIPLEPLLCENGRLSGLSYSNETSQELIDGEIISDDIFVLIIGDKVGPATIHEFEIAKNENKPIMIFRLEWLKQENSNETYEDASKFIDENKPTEITVDDKGSIGWLQFLNDYNDGSYSLNIKDKDDFKKKFYTFIREAVPLLIGYIVLGGKRCNEFEYEDILKANGQHDFRCTDKYYDESIVVDNETLCHSYSYFRKWAFIGKSMSGKTRAAQRFIKNYLSRISSELIVIPIRQKTEYRYFDLLKKLSQDDKDKYVFFIDDIDKIKDQIFITLFEVLINSRARLVITASDEKSSWIESIGENYDDSKIIQLKELSEDDWRQCRCKLELNGIKTQEQMQTSVGAIYDVNSSNVREKYRSLLKDRRFFTLVHAIKAMWIWKRTNRGNISTLTDYMNYLDEETVTKYSQDDVTELLATFAKENIVSMGEDSFECDDYIVEEIFEFQFKKLHNDKDADLNSYKDEIKGWLNIDSAPSELEMCLSEIAIFISCNTEISEMLRSSFKFLSRMGAVLGANEANLSKIRVAFLEQINSSIKVHEEERINDGDFLEIDGISYISPEKLFNLLGDKINVTVQEGDEPSGNYHLFNVADAYYSHCLLCIMDINKAVEFYNSFVNYKEKLDNRLKMANMLLKRDDANPCIDALRSIAAEVIKSTKIKDSISTKVVFKYLDFTDVYGFIKDNVLIERKQTSVSRFSTGYLRNTPVIENSRNKFIRKVWIISAFDCCKSMAEFNSLVQLLKEKKYADNYDKIISMFSRANWKNLVRSFSYRDRILLVNWVNNPENISDAENYENVMHRAWANNVILPSLDYEDAIEQISKILDKDHDCKSVDNYTCNDIIKRLSFDHALNFFDEFNSLIKKVREHYQVSLTNYNVLLDKAKTRDDLLSCLSKMNLRLEDLFDGNREDPIDPYTIGAIVRNNGLSQDEIEKILCADARNQINASLRRKLREEDGLPSNQIEEILRDDDARNRWVGEKQIKCVRPITVIQAVLPTRGRVLNPSRKALCGQLCTDCEPECLRFHQTKSILLDSFEVSSHGLTKEEQTELLKSPCCLSLLFRPFVEKSSSAYQLLKNGLLNVLKDERVYTRENLCHKDRNIVNEVLKNHLIYSSYKDKRQFLDGLKNDFGENFIANKYTASILLNSLRPYSNNGSAALSYEDCANEILFEQWSSMEGGNRDREMIISYLIRLCLFSDERNTQNYFISGGMVEGITPFQYLEMLYDYLPYNNSFSSNEKCEKKIHDFIKNLYHRAKGDVVRIEEIHKQVKKIFVQLKEHNFLLSLEYINSICRFDKEFYGKDDVLENDACLDGLSHNRDLLKNLIHGLEKKEITASEAMSRIEEYNNLNKGNMVTYTQTLKNALVKSLSLNWDASIPSNIEARDKIVEEISQHPETLTSSIAIGLLMMTDIDMYDTFAKDKKLYEKFPNFADEFERIRLKKLTIEECVEYLKRTNKSVTTKSFNVVFEKWVIELRGHEYIEAWSEIKKLEFPLKMMGLSDSFIRKNRDLQPDIYTFISFLPKKNQVRNQNCNVLKVLYEKNIRLCNPFLDKLLSSGVLSDEKGQNALKKCLQQSPSQWKSIYSYATSNYGKGNIISKIIKELERSKKADTDAEQETNS